LEVGLGFTVKFYKPGCFIVRDALLRQKEELSKSKSGVLKNAWCSLPSKIHNHCFITMNRFGAMTKSVVI
jgi:hypothetical protein